ncbi:uncharacterized protein LOC143244454 isoform X3 [Tachypleus tridentatus]|uniref:uncharacterized protein LOC143244454 isoform X3 n=1 Tax=Tachypleus tridentatus TaxID=6853 RepID=UPI003FD24808
MSCLDERHVLKSVKRCTSSVLSKLKCNILSKATMDYPQKIKPGIPVLFQAIKPQSPNLLCEGGKDTVPDHPLVDSFIP